MSQRDPICGMAGVIERHRRSFCSERCIAEFERRAAAGTRSAHASRRITDPWIWVPATGLLLGTLGLWWPSGEGVSAIYLDYARRVLLPFLLGLALGGAIDHFIPREYIVKLLDGSGPRVILRATILGFLASTCSHGCLALSIELYRKGASIPAVVSFLLASPWASMSLTLILLSLFGAHGLTIIVGALAIAVATGLVFQRLARRGLIEANPHTVRLEERFSLREDLRARWRSYRWTAHQLATDARGVVAGMLPLGRMVMGWVQLGLILSALLGALVPTSALSATFGPSLPGLLLTLLAAAVIEVCSEGTAPLAFELYRRTGALGNAFAFLMGGVVTDYTELAALWTSVGRRTVLWLLRVTLPLVVAMGWLLNRLQT